MGNKTYRYYVSYIGYKNEKLGLGGAFLLYDEPMDTQDMLDRAKRDIERIDCCTDVTILFFKRIKGNR